MTLLFGHYFVKGVFTYKGRRRVFAQMIGIFTYQCPKYPGRLAKSEFRKNNSKRDEGA